MKILRQAKPGDPIEVERAALDDDMLERLPEDTCLLSTVSRRSGSGRDGGTVHVQVEWMERAGYWEHKFNLRQLAVEAVGIRLDVITRAPQTSVVATGRAISS